MGEIRTERLVLRVFTRDDLDAYEAYRTDPGVMQWMTSAVAPPREALLARIDAMAEQGGPGEADWFSFAIDVDGELAGDASCVIRPGGGIAEIGYVLRPAHRGRGYAAEAAGALVDHLVAEHGIHRIEASLAPDNVASMRVLEAIGMTFEVLARDAFCFDGVWEDDLRYAMTAADRAAWLARPRHAPATVELVEIGPDDASLWGRLQTHHSEQRFVSTMPLTWRDALFPEVFEDVVAIPWMRGVLADGERAAFVMLSLTHGTREGVYLWRLLVDRAHQRRGIGSAALRAVIDHLRSEGVPRLYTSYVDGPGTPGPFYERLGFVPTGELLDDEIELVLQLDATRDTRPMHANELHARAQQVVAGVLAQVTDDDLARPTPCAGWTVGDLVQHLLDGHRRVLTAGGREAPVADDTDRQAAFATLSEAACAVFDAPDGLTRPFELPFGTVPGAVFASIRAGDAYAHAWDLATAIGADTDLDREVGEAVLAATGPILPPALRGDGMPFAAEQPCDPSRPIADRYAAFTGRRVS